MENRVMFNQILRVFNTVPLFVQYLVLPLGLIIIILLVAFKSKLTWVTTVILTGLYMLVLHFSATWEMSVGYYTRYFLELLFLATCIFSYIKQRGKPLFIKPKITGYVGYAFGFVIIILLLIFNVNNIRAYFYTDTAINLQFPFRNGTYLINDGGDGSISSLVNYHYQEELNIRLGYYKAERYANDIIKLDVFGFEGSHFGNEKNLEDYYIYDEIVYSPCHGEIVLVQDGKEDIQPGMKYKDTGNGVVIKVDDVYVMLWHLKKDSILVKAGDTVKAGDPIASIGNSGITHAPHLHIHAAKKHFLYGEGIPVTYDSKNPIKNRIFKNP